MALYITQQSNFHGDTYTDGNYGHRFFSAECVTAIKLFTKENYHKYVLCLHLLPSTILKGICYLQN